MAAGDLSAEPIVLRMISSGFEAASAKVQALRGQLSQMGAAATAGAANVGRGALASGAAVTGLGSKVMKTYNKLQTVSKGLKNFGNGIKIQGQALTRAFTVPIVAIGTYAIASSLKWHRAMLLIKTSAGASTKEMLRMEGVVKRLARVTPFGPDKIGAAALSVERVGYRGATADAALKYGVQAAMIGDANPEDVTTAITGARKVAIKGTEGAPKKAFKNIAALLVAAAGAGNMSLQELVGGFGTGVLAGAKNAGLSLKDVVSSQALVADEGSMANYSGARLRTAFQYLTSPSDKATKGLASIGLSPTALAHTLRTSGFSGGLAQLYNALGGVKDPDIRNQILNKILPPSRGGIIISLMNQLDNLNKKIGQIGDTSKNFDKNLKATQDNPLIRLETAISNMKTSLIDLGDALTPVVIPALIKLINLATRGVKWFNGLSKSHQKFIIILLVGIAVLGPLLILIGGIIAAVGVLTSTVGLVTIAVLAVAAGVIYAYTHFDFFRKFVAGLLWELKIAWAWIKLEWDIGVFLVRGVGAAVKFVVGKVEAIIKKIKALFGLIRKLTNFLGSGPSGGLKTTGAGHGGRFGDAAHTAAQEKAQSAVTSSALLGVNYGGALGAEQTDPSGSTADQGLPDHTTYIAVDGKVIAKATHKATLKAKSRH